MVFDNGSCDEVRNYLKESQEGGRIQHLVLSEKNYGKAGAWNFIFGAAPGKYIAYADSDVYHFPGWLENQLKVLKCFPECGMVTGMPMWTPEEYSTATVQWAESRVDVSLERGRFLPWNDYWKHSKSLGADLEKARSHYDRTEDVVIHFQGELYYVGAAHFQFVSPKDVLNRIIPIPSNRPMGQVRLLDEALNKAGFLRLCTSDWWVQHMGNTMDGVQRSDQAIPREKTTQKASGKFWKMKLPRRIAAYLYHRSFEVLYRD
jgi:hypothetical protein